MKTTNNSNNNLIIIAGPTGIGKSNISLKLAQSLQCDIIGADSRQLYKEMSIGTAKASPEDLQLVQHWMVDSHSIHNEITTSNYEKEALGIINQLFKDNNNVILTGGTGLYIKALIEGLDKLAPPNPTLRVQLEKGLKERGIEYLQEYLKKLDYEAYQKIDHLNSRRLIRTIELSEAVINEGFIIEPKEPRNFNTIPICLKMERRLLYNKINLRVDDMIKNGLLDEVKLLSKYRDYKSLQTVGYTEMFKYLDGSISYDDAVELIKRNSRRYAKRQMTWFRNQGEWSYFEATKYEKILSFIQKEMASTN